MPKIEVSVKNKISEIVGKANSNLTQPVLFFRDFSLPGEITGDLLPPQSEELHHYEAGIIAGKVQNLPKRDAEIISLGGLSFNERHRYDSYIVSGDQAIPVKRNLKGILRGHSRFFRFPIETLETLQDANGRVLLDARAVRKSLQHSFYDGDMDDLLEGFNALFGIDEISSFLEDRQIDSSELIEALYNPAGTENKVRDFYYAKANEYVQNALALASDVARDFLEIRNLERDLGNARYEIVQGQDGVSRGWDNRSNHVILRYQRLRNDVLDKISALKKQVEMGNEIYKKEMPFPRVDGSSIGFPGDISFGEYSSWVNGEFYENVHKVINELNGIINDKVSKAR